MNKKPAKIITPLTRELNLNLNLTIEPLKLVSVQHLPRPVVSKSLPKTPAEMRVTKLSPRMLKLATPQKFRSDTVDLKSKSKLQFESVNLQRVNRVIKEKPSLKSTDSVLPKLSHDPLKTYMNTTPDFKWIKHLPDIKEKQVFPK